MPRAMVADQPASPQKLSLLGRPHPQFAVCILHFAFCLAWLPLKSSEAQESNRPISGVTERTTVKRERYLGVVTETVPEVLAVQLKDHLTPGRGLVVKRLLPDSPAQKAGIRPFDVLTKANGQSLSSPDQLKEIITLSPQQSPIQLELVREAKTQTVDVLPAERMISRLIHRHAGEGLAATAEKRIASTEASPAPAIAEVATAYSVSVRTQDGQQFQVEVSLPAQDAEEVRHQASGSPSEVMTRLKSLPKPVRESVSQHMVRLTEDRHTLRTVQFRFQPRRQGQQQALAVTLRKPESKGSIRSFEWQQPMGDAPDTVPLETLLKAPAFTAQLKDLDPAVRDKIESTLKDAVLPAGTLKVESSQ